jgi:hypothetical protein
MGCKLGDSANPLLLSVRSGAAVSDGLAAAGVDGVMGPRSASSSSTRMHLGPCCKSLAQHTLELDRVTRAAADLRVWAAQSLPQCSAGRSTPALLQLPVQGIAATLCLDHFSTLYITYRITAPDPPPCRSPCPA